MENQQRLAQAGDVLGEVLLRDVVDEFTADAEGAPGERDLDLAPFADRIDVLAEQPGHMAGIGGCCNRRYRACLRYLAGGRQHGGAAETMPDQQRGRPVRRAKVVRGGNEILDVGRERGIGELALAHANPGEIEPQHRDSERL